MVLRRKLLRHDCPAATEEQMFEIVTRQITTVDGEHARVAEGSAAGLAQALYEAYHFADWTSLGTILHPYGRFLPLLAHGSRSALAKDDVLALVAGIGSESQLSSADIQITQVSHDAVLCVDRPSWKARTSPTRASMVTISDGLVYRERGYASAPEAYRSYLHCGLLLGMP
jgi:hypothetical protein